METTRTTAGYRLWSELSARMNADEAMKEVQRRVKVRTEPLADDAIRVWTCTDDGEWIDEGKYKA